MRKRLDGAVRRATKSAELSWLKRLRYPFLERKVDLGVEKVDVFAGTGHSGTPCGPLDRVPGVADRILGGWDHNFGSSAAPLLLRAQHTRKCRTVTRRKAT